MPNKKINSIRHGDKRAQIPSQEEAGYETANPRVQEGNDTLELPKNPVVHRGQDPELWWMDKYGKDDREDVLKVDIRSLYRHEHIAPEQLIAGLYKVTEEKKNPEQGDLFSPNELFGNALERDELEKVSEYYEHSAGWTNRLIQGDSHLVMASLLEREGMAGQVQTIYIDPPYGISYNSNWQMKLNDRNVKDGRDEHLSGEPEMIKAFRDTWELGIHSYLSYLRDRLLVAKELLTESGSCFVQISDENVHLVRNVMDEVFGSENFVSLITYKTSSGLGSGFLSSNGDYIIWYGKRKNNTKFRQLFINKEFGNGTMYKYIKTKDGEKRKMNNQELSGNINKGDRPYRLSDLVSSGLTESCVFEINYIGRKFIPRDGYSWKTNTDGIKSLIKKNRLDAPGKTLQFVKYYHDFPVQTMSNFWNDTVGELKKNFVVQTSREIIKRCLLMTTDPGDLVLDPTCGSGTTAYVAEQWGRRWITIDTSRIALNIAKQRLMTANFPYYELHDEEGGNIRQGFKYKTVPHITLRALANDEEPDTETLYDQPYEDKKKLRVAGPFTVETLQSFEPAAPRDLASDEQRTDDPNDFEDRIFEHLKSAGVKNGIKNEQAVFLRIEGLSDAYLHAEGFYQNAAGVEQKAYFHIGPKFGTVSKTAVNEAVKACRRRGDAEWLIILGFSFESNIENRNVTTSVGSFEVSKVRMHDDLMQDGLIKKDKKAASFVTIGEPDIRLHRNGDEGQVEIRGLDIYDPIKNVVHERNLHQIAYWMVDTDYDGSNFVVQQVFFCGGKKDEFKKWQKGLSSLAKIRTKRRAEHTLRIELDDEAFDRLYGFESHPFAIKSGQCVAVRVISQFGEESTKVLEV